MENGLTEEKIASLDDPDGPFTDRERLALEFAERMALDHHGIDDELFARLRTAFDDGEILELGMMIGQYLGFGRLLKILDLEPRVCPVDGDP
jgi:alkylhydroperoxidase family enzyme